MSEETEQIRRMTEAKWSGAINAIVKQLPMLFAAVALGISSFNGCKVKDNSSEINKNVKWIGQHLDQKQNEIDQLKESKTNDASTNSNK